MSKSWFSKSLKEAIHHIEGVAFMVHGVLSDNTVLREQVCHTFLVSLSKFVVSGCRLDFFVISKELTVALLTLRSLSVAEVMVKFDELLVQELLLLFGIHMFTSIELASRFLQLVRLTSGETSFGNLSCSFLGIGSFHIFDLTEELHDTFNSIFLLVDEIFISAEVNIILLAAYFFKDHIEESLH